MRGFSRRLALVSLDWTRAKDPPLSLGHASILAGIRTSHADLAAQVVSLERSVIDPSFDPEVLADEILSLDRENLDVAIGCFVWNEQDVQAICQRLQSKNFSGKILLGGPQISYCPPGDLERLYPHANVFLRGYAEESICTWLSCEEDTLVPGMHIAADFDWGRQAQPDFDKLASPLLSGTIPLQPFMRWETQRGCPFVCSFCQHRDQSDPQTRQQRGRSSFCDSRIHAEAELICKDGIVTDLAVLDPVFNSGGRFMFVLDALLEFGYCGKISLQCRFEMVTKAFLEAVSNLDKQNGAKVTLEFGLQTVNKAEWGPIMRPNNLRRAQQTIDLLKEYDLDFEVSLIYGLPNQTLESFITSVNWCLERHVPRVKAWPLMLLRGTALQQQKQQYGLIEEIDSVEFCGLQSEGMSFGRALRVMKSIPHVVESKTFTRAEWTQMSELSSILRETEDAHPARLSY